MELLEHQGGSVLTPLRQTALCFLSIHCLWVRRAWGGAGCALGVPALSSCDLQGLWELHFGHQSSVSSLLGCRSCGAAWLQAGIFLWHRRAAASTAPWCQRQQLLDPLPSPARAPSPPPPRWGLSPSTVPRLGVVGTPKFLPAHFPRERSLPGFPPPLCRSSCALRLESLSVFLFEVTSQLAQGSGFLCSGQAERPGQGGPGSAFQGRNGKAAEATEPPRARPRAPAEL